MLSIGANHALNQIFDCILNHVLDYTLSIFCELICDALEEDVVNKLQYIKAFGLRIFAIKSIRRMVLKSNSSLAWKINDINERTIENYLIETTEKSRKSGLAIDLNPIKTDVPNEPIWVLWYQGIEKAPDIVRCCVESIKEYSNGHQVIVLSEDNLHEYIELPDFIMEKFKKGYITRTHLSDLI